MYACSVAAVPLNEQDRLKALLKLQILDTEPDSTFDAVMSLAASIFQVPIVLVSLIDEQRQWFKSRQGLDLRQTDRKLAFCAHAILQPDIFIVEDALQDDRFSGNPLVCTIPNIRFYAGCPLINEQGYALGTLCIIDLVPRQMTEQDKTILRKLAVMVIDRLNEHKRKLRTEHKLPLLDVLPDSIPDALVACNSEGQLEQFNKVARDWHGVDVCHCDSVLWSHHYDLYEEDGHTVLPVERIPLLRAFHGETVFSHELRTPITAISSGLGLVINQVLGPVPEKALVMPKVTSQNSKRLQLLVNDLLDMEKLNAGKMDLYLQPCDLALECQQAVVQNQPYIPAFCSGRWFRQQSPLRHWTWSGDQQSH